MRIAGGARIEMVQHRKNMYILINIHVTLIKSLYNTDDSLDFVYKTK